MSYKLVLTLMLCALGVARASGLSVEDSKGVQGESCGSVMPVDAPPARILQAGSDDERGCCIIELTSGRKCAYASRGFCRVKADEAGVSHRFHASTSCSSVPQCQG